MSGSHHHEHGEHDHPHENDAEAGWTPYSDVSVPDGALAPGDLSRRRFLQASGVLGAAVGAMVAGAPRSAQAVPRSGSGRGYTWLDGDHHIRPRSSGRGRVRATRNGTVDRSVTRTVSGALLPSSMRLRFLEGCRARGPGDGEPPARAGTRRERTRAAGWMREAQGLGTDPTDPGERPRSAAVPGARRSPACPRGPAAEAGPAHGARRR
jgi:hypothetical protein